MTQTYASDPANALLGKGKLYLDRLTTAGVKQGYFAVGNASVFTQSSDDTRAELYDYQTPAAGLFAASTSKRKVVLTAKIHEFNLKNLMLAMMGDELFYTQSSATITGEALTSTTKLGAVYRFAKRSASSIVVKQGATTLVLDTDYSVLNATIGLIKILTTGAATADAALTVDYSAAAIAGTTQPKGAPYTKSAVKVAVMFLGDPADGPTYEAYYWLGSIQPQGDIGFIQDEYGDFTLSIEILNDSAGNYGGSATEPYGRLIAR